MKLVKDTQHRQTNIKVRSLADVSAFLEASSNCLKIDNTFYLLLSSKQFPEP